MGGASAVTRQVYGATPRRQPQYRPSQDQGAVSQSRPSNAGNRHLDHASARRRLSTGRRDHRSGVPGPATLIRVHDDLTRILTASGEVVMRAGVGRAHWVLDRALARGEMTRLFPGTFVRTDQRDEPRIRWSAALRYAGGSAALCSVTGLQVWGLRAPTAAPVHVCVGRDRQLRTGPEVIIHRRAGFRPEPALVRRRDGLLVAR